MRTKSAFRFTVLALLFVGLSIGCKKEGPTAPKSLPSPGGLPLITFVYPERYSPDYSTERIYSYSQLFSPDSMISILAFIPNEGYKIMNSEDIQIVGEGEKILMRPSPGPRWKFVRETTEAANFYQVIFQKH